VTHAAAVVALLIVACTEPAIAASVEDEMRHIAANTTHGWTQNRLSTPELSARLDRGERLTITCASISQLAILRLRTRLGVDARLVGSVTLEEPDTFNDGHIMVEVANRARNRWELYDLDNNLQPVDAAGEPITIQQFVNARERRYRVLADDQLVDWTDRPDLRSRLGWIYEPGGLERFYDRILQTAVYYGIWVVDAAESVMPLVWRINEDFINVVEPSRVRALTGPPYQAPPVAQITVAASAQAFTDEPVAFDGSTSSDPDGTIVSYAWDFDGDGTFDETNATATTSRSYPTAGAFTVKLRVTDEHGHTHDATRSLTVRSRLPSAAFTATPAIAGKRQSVTFDGSAASDGDGRIAKHEWDLDGAGFVEGPATTSHSYATAGGIAVKLRVTDNDGRTAETTRIVTITNAAPTAALAASTATPGKGADVTFDAGGSADADGTVAGYAWDLDGDGSFETPGGATPSITHRYSAVGPVTARVRVTDDDGATAEASVDLTVAEPVQPPVSSSEPASASPAPTRTPAAAPALRPSGPPRPRRT